MKKLLLTCGMLALLGGAGTAQAQTQDGPLIAPWLHATTTLHKTVTDNENILVNTTVTISQLVTIVADDAAEASATANQNNFNNHDCGNCAEKLDVIDTSVHDNTGLASVNQAGGNDNNQGTLVSVAVDTFPGNTGSKGGTVGTTGTPTGGQGFAHAQAEATQINGSGPIINGEAFLANDVEAVDLQFRNALITNSGNHNVGLFYINQGTGNNDNQLNELSLAFSERPTGAAIAEADLGQFNLNNTVGEGGETQFQKLNDGIHKNATITASLNNNLGVFGVNQSVGNNGNQANIVSIAAVGSNLPGF